MATHRRALLPSGYWTFAVLVTGIAIAGVIHPARASAQQADALSGVWILQPELSRVPAEAGWNMIQTAPGGETQAPGSGSRRGGRGGGSGGRTPVPTARSLSEEDVRRAQQLTLAVRHPASRLIISQETAQVVLREGGLPPRILHPGGREDVVAVDQATMVATSRWDGGRLVIRYSVDPDRDLRYELSRPAGLPQLQVTVTFLGLGGGDVAHLVYAAGSERDAPPSPATAASAPAQPAAREPGADPSPPHRVAAASPDAELKGLRSVGLVVEGLDDRSTTCGLSQSTIESFVSNEISAAGLTVRKDADDDAYFYVNVLTTTPSSGLCVSRYDVILYTHATTTLTHQGTPTLVEVSLLRKGGLAGGAPSAHGARVTADLRQYVAQFATRIAAANR